MNKHLLLEEAFIYKRNKVNSNFEDCHFDGKKGYWVTNDQLEPCILSSSFAKPRTKKADAETGEDQKGE